MKDCHCVFQPGRCLDVRCDECPFRLMMIPKKPTKPDRLIYLATVYSKHPRGIEVAFREAAEITGRLLVKGYTAYSPIAHTHPIAKHADLDPYDHDIWMPFDEVMMEVCDTLLIATMPGWQESKGIAHEIAFFTKHGKPIWLLDPKTLAYTPYDI